MRKHVAPAHPDASIPDPDRGGFLPPAGRTVAWTPHWAVMLMRGEILVSDPRDEAERADATEAAPNDAAQAAPIEGEPGAGHDEPQPDA